MVTSLAQIFALVCFFIGLNMAQIQYIPPSSVFTTTNFASEPQLYYRFTVSDWKQYSHILSAPTSYIITNNSAILFAPYFTNFYTFGQYLKSFRFFEPDLQFSTLDAILLNITNTAQITDMKLSEGQIMQFHRSAISSLFVTNGSTFNQLGMFGCVEFTNPVFSAQYEYRNKLYYCCNTQQQCDYKSEPSLYVLAEVLLHFLRFGFAVIFIGYITGKYKYFHQEEYMLTHITNSYFMPDFWLASLLPALKKFSYNIKNWIIILVIGVHVVVFLLCIVFAMQPLEPVRNELQKDDPKFLFISVERFVKWDSLLYVFGMLPPLFVVTVMSTILKLKLPRMKHNQITKSLRSNSHLRWIERVFRFFISAIIGIILAILWIFLMYISNVLSEFHAVMLFVTGLTCVVGITVYMVVQQPQTSYFWILNRIKPKKKVSEVGDTYIEMSTTQELNDIDGRKTNSNASLIHSANIAELYIFYVFPTYLFEMIWITCFFYLSFIAATVITRFIWSSLLLFALYPDQLNLYVYLLTLAGAVFKFCVQLNQPYELVKTTIIQEKSLVLRDSIDSWNDFMKTMTVDSIKERLKLNAYIGFYIPVTWRYFLSICKEINTTYFLRGTLFRMIITILVLLIFFLISHVFGKSIFGQSDFFKFLVTSLMPLIPSIIDTIIPAQTPAEMAVFNARYKAAVNVIQSSETKKAFSGNPPVGMVGALVLIREEKEKQL